MYTLQRFVLMSLDPVHVGTGGYRLGRVDLSIMREPGTDLPKIPGTSLSGTARSYAAMHYGKLRCAGQGGGKAEADRHCGESTCPLCYTFGTARSDAEGGCAGTVNVYDAQLLLFPIRSTSGPVWVTTARRLSEVGCQVTAPKLARDECATTIRDQKGPLNLGWLLFPSPKDGITLAWSKVTPHAWSDVEGQIVLVHDSLFPQLVNSNLEVRTSVSINPRTGAAREGALFTYEALPRASWLWCDVVEDDYRTGDKPWPVSRKFRQSDHSEDPWPSTWNRPLDVVRTGLQVAQYLGVGGMSTRGFGRICVLADWEVTDG